MTDKSDDEANGSIMNTRKLKFASRALLVAITYNLLVGSALAADDASELTICDVEYLGPAINALFSIAVGGALVLGILTWVITSFTESLPLPQSTKQSIKQQRNGAIASSLRAIVVPAFILAILSVMDLGIPECISILP